MNIIDSIGSLATAVAADVRRVEDAMMRVTGSMESIIEAKLAPVASELMALADEVHSVIDDAADSSPANTWSVDQIKAHIDARIAEAVAALRESMPPMQDTHADFAATYHEAKKVVPAADPNA